MKIKKFNKKLGLNKSTVVNLNNSEMGAVHGGLQPTIDLSNCATNCLCETVVCTTQIGGSCPVTRRCW